MEVSKEDKKIKLMRSILKRKEMKKHIELRKKVRKSYEKAFESKNKKEQLEEIRLEKNRVNIELEICKAPFLAILVTVGVSVLSPFLAVGFTDMIEDNKIRELNYRWAAIIIIAIYTILIILGLSASIKRNQNSFRKYLVRKDILDEMELEELESISMEIASATTDNELEEIKNEITEIKEFFGIRK